MKELARLARAATLRVAGLMSGTSADGVDVAILDIRRGDFRLLAFETFPYPPRLRSAVLDLCRPETARVDDICHLNFALGEVFASALIRLAGRAGIALESIDLIGSHGQTIHHMPRGRRFGRRSIRSTLQIAEPSVLAERTGITTVADFRPRDVAAGGLGAPLVAYADWRLFSHGKLGRAMQNLGGIANVTYLRPKGTCEQIVAFDTGPGNMILDRMAHHISGGKWRCDRDGRLARQGEVSAPLLAEWLGHAYFRRRPPKTTGREEFGEPVADRMYRGALKRGIDRLDVLATATALTAESIARAYRRWLPGPVDEVIVSGGGARNPTLMGQLADRLTPASVIASDAVGLDADAKEAVAFAVLAAETIRGRCNNAPAATGARRAVVLGKIVPGGRGHASAGKRATGAES